MYVCFFFFFQAEDGIRDLVRSRGLGDVYKRQRLVWANRLSGELVQPFGSTDVVPLSQRVFLGGRNSLRGFSRNSVGPRGELGNVVGGDLGLAYTTEPVSYTNLTLPTSDLV